MKDVRYDTDLTGNDGWQVIDRSLFNDGIYSQVVTQGLTKNQAIDLMNKLNRAYVLGYIDCLREEKCKVSLSQKDIK